MNVGSFAIGTPNRVAVSASSCLAAADASTGAAAELTGAGAAVAVGDSCGVWLVEMVLEAAASAGWVPAAAMPDSGAASTGVLGGMAVGPNAALAGSGGQEGRGAGAG